MASTVSTPHRSSLSMAHSLNHSRGDLQGSRKVKTPQLPKWNKPASTVSVSTIPPIDSGAWRRLTRFQRRFYEWLVYSHHLPVAGGEGNGYANLRVQPPPPPDIYNDYQLGEDVGSSTNAYDEDELEEQGQAFVSPSFNEGLEKNVYSPYVSGMDIRLAQFVSQHNVNMGDGAVIYSVSGAESADAKKKKAFQPPCGCTRQQFSWAVGGITVTVAVMVAVAVTLGVIFSRVKSLKFPEAEPWWTHGLVYQIHVPTFANDVGGALGRFKDVTSRMVYLADKVFATAAILTGVLDTDKNGVRNWKTINQDINSEGDVVDTLLAGMDTTARGNEIELMLGMPLYATSDRHPWFTQSVQMNPLKFASFYLWRKEKPVNSIEARYYAFSSVRNEYYRHVHGNPSSPLLNLSDPEVQAEMKSVIAFWKEELGISGVFIINSTNILNEMAAPLTSILTSGVDNNTDAFTWFADDPNADKLLTGKPLCYYELISNERITTRTEDISAQLYSILSEIKQRSCSPVWRLTQRSADFTDYFSLQKFAAFLPGLSVMRAGEEVQLMTGATELIQWNFTNPADFKTYWPINVLPDETAKQRLEDWERYSGKTVGVVGTIFNTGWKNSEVRVMSIPRTENLFVVQRIYLPIDAHFATFFVSFQALNAFTNLAEVVATPDGSSIVNLPIAHYGTYTAKGYEVSGSGPITSSSTVPPGGYQQATTSTYDATKLLIGAVAAAAVAGYSTVSNPLSITNMIGAGSTDAAAYASRYHAACQAAYQHQHYDYQQHYGNNFNLQRHTSAFQAPFSYGFSQQAQNPSTSVSIPTPAPTPQTSKIAATTGRKTRKRPLSGSSTKFAATDAKKREDFDKLVRARTDKLLSDGPLFVPLTVNEAVGNASSTSSCNSLANSTEGASVAAAIASSNAQLLRTVLDEKIRKLMTSPSVRGVLRSRQAMVGARKRSSELFVVQLHSARS
ncbi:Alpha-glucosidase [Taenia crassiceps]|uniref:Alpha-glucosidase n=1 Tax=Taenia crassiceps TaxID=6207 RepID=A0ABR4QNU5_9CEST